MIKPEDLNTTNCIGLIDQVGSKEARKILGLTELTVPSTTAPNPLKIWRMSHLGIVLADTYSQVRPTIQKTVVDELVNDKDLRFERADLSFDELISNACKSIDLLMQIGINFDVDTYRRKPAQLVGVYEELTEIVPSTQKSLKAWLEMGLSTATFGLENVPLSLSRKMRAGLGEDALLADLLQHLKLSEQSFVCPRSSQHLNRLTREGIFLHNYSEGGGVDELVGFRDSNLEIDKGLRVKREVKEEIDRLTAVPGNKTIGCPGLISSKVVSPFLSGRNLNYRNVNLGLNGQMTSLVEGVMA